MSETKEQVKHTPGPWTVDTQGSDDDFVIRSVQGKNMGGGTEVAIVTTGSYSDTVEEANARLIAAAPEQNELLQIVKAGFDEDPGTSDLDDEQPICVRMTLGDYRRIKRVLWKAEGR